MGWRYRAMWGGRSALLFGFEESLLLTMWVSVGVTGLILDVCACLADFLFSVRRCVCAMVTGHRRG